MPSIYQKTVLPSGVIVVSENIPRVESVSLGIWISSGVKVESEEWAGVSHFIEHMLFKGTPTRSARQIAEQIDGVGGQLNGFTNREYTCVYAKVLRDHLPLVVDVLCDMILYPSFDPEEMEREKLVVLEEIKRFEDTPEELVHDLFVQMAWESHPLGHSLLGKRQVIGGLSREQVVNFYQQHYLRGSIIVAAAGSVLHERLVEMVQRQLGGLPPPVEPAPERPPVVKPHRKYVARPTEQVHFCLGLEGLPQADSNRYALAAIDTALGGGMSSRLFQEIREKRGLTYSIGSFSLAYRTAGLFAVSGGTSQANLEQVIELSRQELDNVRQNGLEEEELARAKEQLKGGLALALESTSYRMRRLAISQMYWGHLVSFEEVVDQISRVDPDQVLQVAGQILGSDTENLVAIGPSQ